MWSQGRHMLTGADAVIPSQDGLQFYSRFHQTENPVWYFDLFVFVDVGAYRGFFVFALHFK